MTLPSEDVRHPIDPMGECYCELRGRERLVKGGGKDDKKGLNKKH